MKRNCKFMIHYNSIDDVLTIYDPKKNMAEGVELTEDIIIGLDENSCLSQIEILDASQFLGVLNELVTKKVLKNLKVAELEWKEYRNNWFIQLNFAFGFKRNISQPLPPLSKSEYKSPLICAC